MKIEQGLTGLYKTGDASFNNSYVYVPMLNQQDTIDYRHPSCPTLS